MFGLFKRKNTEEEQQSKNEPGLTNFDESGEEITSEADNSISSGITPKVWRKNSVYQEPETVEPEPYNFTSSKVDSSLEGLVGKLVICLTNEVENPIIGVGIEILQEQRPVLSVYDIVRKETIMANGVVFAYTEQKFNALNQLEPNARISLFFDSLGLDTINKRQQPSKPLVSNDDWKKKVLEAIERINRGEWT